MFRAEFDEQEWLSLACIFALTHRVVAQSDGDINPKEQREIELLIGGRVRVLSFNKVQTGIVAKHFGAFRHDLAEELVRFDDPIVLRHLASSNDLSAGLSAGAVLDQWCSRVPHDPAFSSAQAQGVRLQAICYGVRVAQSSRPVFGKAKAKNAQFGAIASIGEALGVTLDQSSLVSVMLDG
jgi:hypothetical protein